MVQIRRIRAAEEAERDALIVATPILYQKFYCLKCNHRLDGVDGEHPRRPNKWRGLQCRFCQAWQFPDPGGTEIPKEDIPVPEVDHRPVCVFPGCLRRLPEGLTMKMSADGRPTYLRDGNRWFHWHPAKRIRKKRGKQ